MTGCTIDPSASITGKSSLGAHVSVGANAQIEDCIIGDNVTIGDGARLSHCFIFHNTVIPAGTSQSRHYLSSAISEPINLP